MRKIFFLLFLINSCYLQAQQEISNNILINKTIDLFSKSINEENIISKNDTIFIQDDNKFNDHFIIDGIYAIDTINIVNMKDTLINSINFKTIEDNLFFINTDKKFYYVFEIKIKNIENDKININCKLLKYCNFRKKRLNKNKSTYLVESIFEKKYRLGSAEKV